tara:strand:- start:131 stop:547 length:417 start_codon:yes stop_codon:yes gene_type:complete
MNLVIARLALNLLKSGKIQRLRKLASQFNVKGEDGAVKFIKKAHKTVTGTPSSKIRPVNPKSNTFAPDGYFTEKFHKTGYYHGDFGKSDWEVLDILRRDLRPSKKTMKSWFGPKMPKKMKKELLNEDFGLLDLADLDF